MSTRKDERSPKRRKLDFNPPEEELVAPEHHEQDGPHKGLDKPISPPPSRRRDLGALSSDVVLTRDFDDIPQELSTSDVQPKKPQERDGGTNYVPSPVQLTHIEDMAPHQNVDAVKLKDILGDPMIKECWNFNFLFDIDFVMKHFDDDVRDLVKVRVVHGFWKNDDERRINLLETAERYPNIELHHAYIPDPFGTHHSKMVVLFRHDDCAQVVIHTANMISRDWGNMTQAVWRSPLLPLRPSKNADNISIKSEVTSHPIGSGERFKVDFLRYLKAYGKRIASLTTQLLDYDFSAIRAAFIGSAPSRQKPIAAKPSDQTSFGWLGLQEILSTIPIEPTINKTALPFHIVIQVSSIATLGASPTWLMHFQSVLSRSSTNAAPSKNPQSTFFSKSSSTPPQPKHSIVFPVPSEIRTSLDGYASGASIHTKLQSAQQQKQLEYMRPLLCHWKPSSHDIPRRGGAQRGPAAPHIKTYIRFHDTAYNRIDWALLTSANLSKQAWGDVVSKKDEVWIQSWEAGVVVWPDLYGEDVAMVPVFGRDVPEEEDTEAKGDGREGEEGKKTVVGFRMPYDLPLNPYEVDERPWCATVRYEEPDWKGLAWGGY